MKYLFVTALMVILLVASASALPEDVVANIEVSATGGTITQAAQNNAIAMGDDSTVTESITMTGVGTGVVTQDAQNNALVGGDDATVDQTVTMAAQGSNTNQNLNAGTANNLVGGGDDASIDQSLTMTATATTGNAQQLAVQTAFWLPGGGATADDVSINQTTNLAAAANNGFVNQVGANAALVFGARATIYQNITGIAVAEDNIVQAFGNLGMGFGNGARYTQVVMGGANSTDGSIFQLGGNLAGVPGAAFTGMRSNQSVLFSAIAGEDVLQIGGNAAFAQNGATLGQEVGMSADAEDVGQVAGNFATAGNNFAANQAIALTVESDEGNVAQLAGNLFVDRNLAGNTNSRLGQLISAQSTGSDNTLQLFGNFAFLNHNAGNSEYTVAQANIANATADTAIGQFQTNTVFWELNADGALGQDIDGRAGAPTVFQFQQNSLIPV